MKSGMTALLITILTGLSMAGPLHFSRAQSLVSVSLRAATVQSSDKPDAALKKLTAEEQAALNKPGEAPNDRAKSYIRIASVRLKTARLLVDQEKSAEADEQIEIYTALVADAGRYLSSSVKVRDKAHKTIEQGLKEQLRLLEGLRRDVTAAHGEIVEKAIKTTSNVRLQALRDALGAENILNKPNQ